VESICHFYELPDDVISLIMLEISFEDIMRLFSTSTTMQRAFGRLKDQNLWKRVAAKMFNGFKFKFLQSQPIADWQSHVMTEMK
jgi:very-short-patch-repair endonuclease